MRSAERVVESLRDPARRVRKAAAQVVPHISATDLCPAVWLVHNSSLRQYATDTCRVDKIIVFDAK